MAEKTVYIIDLNDKVTGKLKNVQNEAKKTDGAFAGMANMLGGLGIGVGIGTLTALAKGIYDITAGAEQTKIQFEVMLGSVEKAGSMIKNIRQFAAATPFETEDLEKAATTMLQFGIAADQIMPNIRMLGDVAGGNSEKFDRLTYAFSQIQATGRLMGQDLMQLINAGFNPLQTISTKTGISIGNLKKQMEDGLVTSKMVSEAFRIETEEGGRFFGMMEKQSKTVSGRMGTLLDEIKMIGLAIGQDATGGMNMFLEASQKVVATVSSTTWSDLFSSVWEGDTGLRMLGESLKAIGEYFGIVNTGGLGFQHILDGITIAIRASLLPLRTMFDLMMTLIEVIKSTAIATTKLFQGDAEGALNSFGGVGEKLKKVKDNFTTLFDFKDRSFGESKTNAQKESDRKLSAEGLKSVKTALDPGAFNSLDGGAASKSKSKKQGAGGISLNESRNGATNIVFNIDTFQKNEFIKDGAGINSQVVRNILNDMALALTTVMNDSQIVARQ